VRALLVAVVALIPAAFTWWSGRRLITALEDPALPERLQTRRRWITQLTIFLMVAIALTGGMDALWGAPLLLVTMLAAGFPTRRTLFGESWSLPQYLSEVVRFTAAGLGFYLLLALVPALVWIAGSLDWLVALLAGTLLVAWNERSVDVFLRLVRAEPLDRLDLQPRLDAVVEKSTAPRPHLWRIGHPGSRWPNALAVRSLRIPSVAFTRTLLDRLEPDEVAAIFAHEVAHLEQWDRKRLTRVRWLNHAAILASLAVAPLVAQLGSDTITGIFVTVWPFVLLLALARRGSMNRAHEAASDARAVELCGDGEALVRALTRLHALARMPRRLAAEVERAATHPSLAQRIRAIRGASSGTSAATATSDAVVIPSTQAGRYAIFERERVVWLDGVPAGTPRQASALRNDAAQAHALRYSQLTDLRLHAPVSGAPTLTAAEPTGKKWSMPIAAADVALLQNALDGIDAKLAPRPLTASPTQGLIASLLSATLLVISVWAVQLYAVVVPALVCMVRPSAAGLAAVGGMATTAALIALLRATGTMDVGGLLVLGSLALAYAVTRARESAVRDRDVTLHVVLLAAIATVGFAVLALGARDGSALRLHELAGGQLGAVAAPLAVAAVLWITASPRRRSASIAAVALAAIPLVLSSRWFAARFVDDPLFTETAATAPAALPMTVDARAELAQPGFGLVLSPNGDRYALLVAAGRESEDDDGDDSAPTAFHVGDFAGADTTIEARALAFLDENTVITVARGDQGLELRRVTIAEPARPTWHMRLPRLVAPMLDVDATSARWRVSGTTLNPQNAIVVEGTAGDDHIEERRYPMPPPLPDMLRMSYWRTFGSVRGALRVRTRFDYANLPLLAFAGAGYGPSSSELEMTDERGTRSLGTSALDVWCLPPTVGTQGGDFLCTATSPHRTLFWSIDATGTKRCLGAVSGRVMAPKRAPDGRVVLRGEAGQHVILDPQAGRFTALSFSTDGGISYEVAVAGAHAAALVTGPQPAVWRLVASR